MVFEDLLKGKKLFRVTEQLRSRVLAALKEELSKEQRILLAIAFGGFIEARYTRDVDVAVYIQDPRGAIEDYGYAEELACKLTGKTRVPVDIVVLNYAPDPILNNALTKGIPLVVKNQRLYYGLRMLAIEQKTASEEPCSRSLNLQPRHLRRSERNPPCRE